MKIKIEFTRTVPLFLTGKLLPLQEFKKTAKYLTYLVVLSLRKHKPQASMFMGTLIDKCS